MDGRHDNNRTPFFGLRLSFPRFLRFLRFLTNASSVLTRHEYTTISPDESHELSTTAIQTDTETVDSIQHSLKMDDIRIEAAAATAAEHNMGLWKSLKTYPKAIAWSMGISTCIVMEGFDIVLLNQLFAFPPFQRKYGDLLPNGNYAIPAPWMSGLSNGAFVGEILGLFISGVVAERIGFRKTMFGAMALVACFVFIIFLSESLVQLLIGEILIGIPWGVFQSITTSYAADVCPLHLRHYLTTYNNLCWVFGQLIASGVLVAMLQRADELGTWSYKIPFALQWVWPLPLMTLIWLAPESPYWLVRHGRVEDAKKSLRRLTSSNTGADTQFNLDNNVSMMIHTNEMEKHVSEGTSYKDLFKGAVNRRRTEIVCASWAIQSLCGSAFMGYSTVFYEAAGLPTSMAFNMSLVQYALGAVGTIASWFLMGWVGRRTLYLYGQLVMTAFLLIIGLTALVESADKEKASWAIGSMLLLFTLTYNITVGPVCYSLVAELSSTRLRNKTIVLARNLYNATSITTNIITPAMLSPTAWNWGAKAGFFWAGSCFLCSVWTYFRLPEPKDRTYGELEILFERGISARKFAKTVLESVADEDKLVQVSSVDEGEKKSRETVSNVEKVDSASI